MKQHMISRESSLSHTLKRAIYILNKFHLPWYPSLRHFSCSSRDIHPSFSWIFLDFLAVSVRSEGIGAFACACLSPTAKPQTYSVSTSCSSFASCCSSFCPSSTLFLSVSHLSYFFNCGRNHYCYRGQRPGVDGAILHAEVERWSYSSGAIYVDDALSAMTMTATATSALPNLSWDEQIVPTLRKRMFAL